MNALAAALCLVLAADAQDSTIRVSPGTQVILKQSNLLRVALANPEVADVKPLPATNEILVLGKAIGRTSITIWTRNGRGPVTRMIVVDAGTLQELREAVKAQVSPSLTVESFGDKIVIDGMLDTPEEIARLRTLVGANPKVKLLAKMNPAILPVLARQITEALHKAGLKNASAVALGGKLVLEGSVQDDEERKRAQLIADSYYVQFAEN